MQVRQFHPDVWAKVDDQRAQVPHLYNQFDFSEMPERFTTDSAGQGMPGFDAMLPEVLADAPLVALIGAYTLMGDVVSDAYAARIPEYGFRRLIDMLEKACAEGLAAVPDAPPELGAFLADMEQTPDWIDMALVNEGARIERNHFAHVVPFAIRGAFLATFMNKYSALPMALTGNLSDKLAAKRVHETATFFTLTVMPGALERHGEAFKAAAMVRLMHSMVRFNVMRREGMWDAAVYGVPIPQVDQMPAGQIGSFLISAQAIKQGRTEFTRAEQAQIELARYRCFLLGLPKALLGETPQEITRLMVARRATLRGGFDEVTCGALVRGTMNTELSRGRSLSDRVDRALERGFSKAFFIKQFLRGDTARAAKMGVRYAAKDRTMALIAGLRILSQTGFYDLLAKIPLLRDIADRRLVTKLHHRLNSYGRADFTSDGAAYRPAHDQNNPHGSAAAH